MFKFTDQQARATIIAAIITTIGVAVMTLVTLWYTTRNSANQPQTQATIAFTDSTSIITLQPSVTIEASLTLSPLQTPTLQVTQPILACNSMPPDGLVLIDNGIWGSQNIKNFLVGTVEIDTDNQNFDAFQMWIDPCLAEQIESSDGRSFWPQVGPANCPSEFFSDIPVGGEEATSITLCANTGIWGLGPPHQIP